MAVKNKKITELKTTSEYKEFRDQFFDQILKLTHEQWLNICLHFENDLDDIYAAMHKITQIRRKIIRDIDYEDREEWKYRLKLGRGVGEHQKKYFLNLPEIINHDGQPYLLAATAYHASDYACRSFILMYENVPVKNKHSILIPCLRPFNGYVTLPSLDYRKKPSKSKTKIGPNKIKLANLSSKIDFIFHIAFPDNYFTYNEKPNEWDPFPRPGFNKKSTAHATWNFDRFVDLECSFGGKSDNRCSICGGCLSHLITLPAIKGMPYTGLSQLTLSTCMKCVGWIGEPIFFKHDDEGRLQSLPLDGEFEDDTGEECIIKPATVHLSKTLPKFYKQNWGKSDDQNLHRIGGTPSWVQGKQTFKCPACKNPMVFLIQVDSELPTVEGTRLLWGSGGVLYIFWCDDCKIDGQMWQCS
jgi:hypothetical protein